MKLSDKQEKVLAKARNTYGAKNQLIVSAEECNELALALLKFIRYESESKGLAETYERVLEERADVEIILNHIDHIYNFSESEILTAMRGKIERLERWVQETDSIEYTTIDRHVDTDTQVSCEGCFYLSHFDDAVEKCIECADRKLGYRSKTYESNGV